MVAVDARPVRRDDGVVRLLDPGYIKGYAPGVRENGGQHKARRFGPPWRSRNLATPGARGKCRT